MATDLAGLRSKEKTDPGPVRRAVSELGDLVSFSGQVLRYTPGSLRYFAEVLRQLSMLIAGSTVFVLFLTLAIGAECGLWYVSWSRTLGAADFTGFVSVACGLNLLFPYVFAHAFAAKVGTGLVAEIGSMRITQEIDAMETTGIDSMRYVIGTRMLAVLIFVPVIYVAGIIAGLVGGWLTGVVQLGELSAARYFEGYWGGQGLKDSLLSMLQTVSMCVGIVLVAVYYGYRASGGPAGVGRGAGRSMIVNVIWIQFMAALWQALLYSRGARVPFGG